ncbi:MAG TPA: hypothetical protein PKI08_05290 [Aquaticitalea sp.]|nr:hypothetical protein [Aquaticitalea sp.]
MSYKSNQFLVLLVKLCIVIAVFVFIYFKLTDKTQLDLATFLQNVSANGVFSIKNLSVLLLLTILNWYFEILKWQKLVASFSNITFKNALEQTLGSFTASLITPNRIGEYGAKILYFEPCKRKKAVLLNVLGNMCQLAVTALFGFWGCWSLAKTHPQFSLQKPMLFVLCGLAVLAIIYFISKNGSLKFKGVALHDILGYIGKTPNTVTRKAFGFSLLRYGIFTFQFYVLLRIFGLPVGYLDAMPYITTMYLLTSIIPNIFIFDVVVKGGVAVYMFAMIGMDVISILTITMLMWLLNFVFPGLVGSYFVLHFDDSKIQQST